MRPSNPGPGPLPALPILQYGHHARCIHGTLDQSCRHVSKSMKMRSRPISPRLLAYLLHTSRLIYLFFASSAKWKEMAVFRNLSHGSHVFLSPGEFCGKCGPFASRSLFPSFGPSQVLGHVASRSCPVRL